MTLRRSSLFRALLWAGLVLFALRPAAPVDVAAELALSPTRALAEIATPLTMWRGGLVAAADEGGWQRDLEEIEALWSDLQGLARPPADLLAGRDPVPAEVVGRVAGDRDRLRVLVRDTTGIVPGLPVVHGRTYVGRVHGVDPGLREVTVDLVTGSRFGVGGRLVDPSTGARPRGAAEVWMTVGGLDSAPGPRGGGDAGVREHLALAVHNPSDREAPPGPVEVAELLPDVDPRAGLARGYRLGELVVTGASERVVLADLDYGAGLYHVFVLCPAGTRAGAVDALDLAVADDRWVPSRPLSLGDPSPWRGGLVVAAGSTAGVEPGAAVIGGLRLVGRVERAGAWSSDVRLLADPGLSLVAVARVAGSDVPHVLGRLVSLGSGRRGADDAWIAFRWEAVVAVDLPEPPEGSDGWLSARLFTGSGEPGLPGGLYVGEAMFVAPFAAAEPGAAPGAAERPGVDPGGEPVVFVRRASTALPDERLWVRVEREGAP